MNELAIEWIKIVIPFLFSVGVFIWFRTIEDFGVQLNLLGYEKTFVYDSIEGTESILFALFLQVLISAGTFQPVGSSGCSYSLHLDKIFKQISKRLSKK